MSDIILIISLGLALTSASENKSCWPALPTGLAIFFISVMAERSAALAPNWVIPPTFIKLSKTFLFTLLASIRLQKSFKERNLPNSLASRIESMAALPTFLIASRPNLIALASKDSLSSIIVNPTSLSLISGGRIFIPILLHSFMAEVIFWVSFDSAVRRAVIYSIGKLAFM